jgi:hypothetical protein
MLDRALEGRGKREGSNMIKTEYKHEDTEDRGAMRNI